MKSVFVPLVALGLAASSAFAQLMINTPSAAVVCQPLLIAWSGGVSPYFLSILPGNQPSAPALVTFPSTNATSVTWLVDIAAQTSLGLDLRDSTGNLAQSAAFSVQPGPDSSCVGKTSSLTFGSTAPAGSTPTAATTTAGAAPITIVQSTTTSAGSPQTSAASGSKTSAGTASTTTKASGASRVTGQVAAAGIIGAAMVALLA